MEFASFIPLIAVLLGIGAVVAGVCVARSKIRKVSREMFGTDSLIQGYNKQKKMVSETPKSVRSMTNVYLPLIIQDFPEFDYPLYKSKAEALLRSFFTAVTTKNVLTLSEDANSNLKNTVTGIIEALNAQNQTQIYAENVFHDTEIARYIKNGVTVTILFNISVGQYMYIEDEHGAVVLGSKDLKHQTIYDVALVYVQDIDKMGGSAVADGLGLNCPNCGAPIKNLGQKFCDHCGSGIIEINTHAWHFDSVKEQSVGKKTY